MRHGTCLRHVISAGSVGLLPPTLTSRRSGLQTGMTPGRLTSRSSPFFSLLTSTSSRPHLVTYKISGSSNDSHAIVTTPLHFWLAAFLAIWDPLACNFLYLSSGLFLFTRWHKFKQKKLMQYNYTSDMTQLVEIEYKHAMWSVFQFPTTSEITWRSKYQSVWCEEWCGNGKEVICRVFHLLRIF